jgi:hypothetical protein
MKLGMMLILPFILLLFVVGSPPAFSADETTGLLSGQEATLRAIAKGEMGKWIPMTQVQARALDRKADAQWQELHNYLLPFGQVVDVYWSDKTQTTPLRYETVGDSTCWTGHYLAALAFRYKATKNPEILQKVKDVLDVFDRLTKVSGRTGYIARFAGPADNGPYREYYKIYGRGEDPQRPGLGKWAYRGGEPYTNLVWLGNSSRDTYIGFNLGISAAWANVDNREVRAKIKEIVTVIGNRMLEDNWSVIDGKGHTTRPTPTFKLSWMRTIATAAPDKFRELVREYGESIGAALKTPRRTYPKTYKEYFANNLGFATAYSLYAMETDPAFKKQLAGAIRDMYNEVKDHLNAHFAMIYLAATGDINETALATATGQLIDIPGPPRWFRAVDHRSDPDTKLLEGGERLEYALLAHEQVPSDFLWQRSPTVSHGASDAAYETPGLDLLLPYWMGRANGIIAGPKEIPSK